MRFKGQLLLPSEPGPGLRVDLEVAGHHLAVESDGGELGAWLLDTVRVRRLEGDTFAMTVAGEDLHFIADDTVSFAYSGMPAIESVTGLYRSRGRLRGLLSRFGAEGPTQLQVESPPESQEDEQPAAIVEEPAAHEPTAVTEIASLQPAEGEAEEDEIVDMTLLISDADDLFDAPARTKTSEPEQRDEPVSVGEASPAEATPTDHDDPLGCPALTGEGLPCRSPILGASGYCYSHDPERAVEDGYRKALEARARMKRKGTARLTKVYSRLEKAMRQVERRELEPDIAVAMAQIARTMCAILDLDEEPDGEGDTELAPRF
ncbi:MAG: hypothetical protein ACRDVL_08420 [Acidimicrobiia bacterium]